MTITVYGQPAPQGSKRFLGMRGGKGIMVESSKAVKPWREAVKYAALEAQDSFPKQIVGPVRVSMYFTLPKPKSAPRNRVTYPDKKPDLSKLVRATEDALTDAGVWEDDARVIQETTSKGFPGEGYNTLDRPGAVIVIESVVA